MPRDTILEKKNKNLERFACFILGFFAILAYVDVIEVMVPYVLILDGVVAVCALVFIGYYLYSTKPRLRLDIVTVSFYVFCIFTLISMIVNRGDLDRNVVAVFQIVQMLSCAIAINVLKDRISVLLIYIGYWVVCISLFILTLSYRMFRGGAIKGITINSNPFGMLLAVAILFCVYIIYYKHTVSIGIIMSPIILYFLAGLYKTSSRTAQLCCIVGLFLFIGLTFLVKLNIKCRRIACFILCLCFILIFMFIVAPRFFIQKYSATSTVFSGREIIWKDSILAAKESLLFGYGGNTALMMEVFERVGTPGYTVYASNHFLHNIYIQILVEYGIMTLVGFVVMVLVLIFKFIVNFFRHNNCSLSLMFAFMLMVMYLLEGITESNLMYFGGTEQFTFILALGIVYAESFKCYNIS